MEKHEQNKKIVEENIIKLGEALGGYGDMNCERGELLELVHELYRILVLEEA